MHSDNVLIDTYPAHHIQRLYQEQCSQQGTKQIFNRQEGIEADEKMTTMIATQGLSKLNRMDNRLTKEESFRLSLISGHLPTLDKVITFHLSTRIDATCL
jgi:hypothetical protein